MKFSLKKHATAGLIGLMFVLGTALGYSQMVIREIDAVYKSKEDGRIISDKEFQSYRGRHTFHQRIRGEKDTLVISAPEQTKEDQAKKQFSNLTGIAFKDFAVEDVHGNPVNSADLRGKVLVLNFWFVACPPCIREIPELNRLVARYSDKEVEFVALARDSEDLLGKFLAHSNFDYRVVANATAIARQNHVYAYPSHMVIDANGVVRYTATGISDNSIEELQKAIEKSIDRL